MSLDKRLREIAEARINAAQDLAVAALKVVSRESGITVTALARIVSGHKTKSVRADACRLIMKDLADAMVASLDDDSQNKGRDSEK